MNRDQLFQLFCTKPRGSGGIANRFSKYIELYSKACKQFKTKNLSKEQIYCFLTRKEHPKCANPNCKKLAEMHYRFSEGFNLFCKGVVCPRPYPKKVNTKSPIYAKELIAKVRELKKSSPSCGNFASWLGRRIDYKTYRELLLNLGPNFDAKTFYDFLFPNSRRTCSSPGCDAPVTFSRWEKDLRYKDFCNGSCAWKNCSETLQKNRKANFLNKTDGLYASPMQDPEVRKIHRQAVVAGELERSGGKWHHPSQRPEVRKKIGETARASEFERSGGRRTHHSQRKSTKAKWSKLRASEEHQAKRSQLQLGRTNGKYSHPMQNPEVQRKVFSTSRQTYSISFHNKTWDVQGFEDAAIRFLVESLQVHPKKIQEVKTQYKYSKRKDGSKRIYTPDLELALRNRTLHVEVKGESLRFGGVDKKTGELAKSTLLKLQAVVAAGDTVMLMVMGKVSGRNTFTPRRAKLQGYILASPSLPNFEIRTDLNSLEKVLLRLNSK